ncbi:MAG: hypothetical protein V9E98_15100 [Candidatus Nanopelagicales bacterium]
MSENDEPDRDQDNTEDRAPSPEELALAVRRLQGRAAPDPDSEPMKLAAAVRRR